MTDSSVQRWLTKTRRLLRLNKLPPLARKIVVSLLGGVILVVGIIMLATPGPGLILVPLGLLLLASEFKIFQKWAQQLIDLLGRARSAYRRWRKRRQS